MGLAGQHCYRLFRREPGPSDAGQDFLMKENAGNGPRLDEMGLVNI